MDIYDFVPSEGTAMEAMPHNLYSPAQDGQEFMLSLDMAQSAADRACAFFGLPEVEVKDAMSTCMWPNDPTRYDDDLLGFNREELMSMGVSGEDTLTLVYTHECAHRTLQGAFNDSWEEELACDFFAGIHAGMGNMNLDNFEASLGQMPGSASHPNGALRAEFIEYGRQVAEEMQARGVEVTYDNCIARLNQHLIEREGVIAEYRERFDDFARGVADGLVSDGAGEAKGFVNDEAWHLKEAAAAQARGDLAAAADHLKSAKMCTK